MERHRMLARSEHSRCIECGQPYGSDLFHYWHGMMEDGPAYWSDRGVLCSPRCAVAHHKKRLAEGTVRQDPAPDPMEAMATRFRR